MKKLMLKIMIVAIGFIAFHDVIYVKSEYGLKKEVATFLKKEVVAAIDGHSLLHQAAIVQKSELLFCEIPFLQNIEIPYIFEQFTPLPLTPPPRS